LRTVKKETIIEFEEKKSKFIGYIKPVSTVAEAEKFFIARKRNTARKIFYRVGINFARPFKRGDDDPIQRRYCDDEKKNTLQKPPVDSEVPKDVPIAPSEPKVDINADMPPLPVTE